MTYPSNSKFTAAPSLEDLSSIEPKINKLSLIFDEKEDNVSTTGKIIKISENIWKSLSQDGKYYLLCHEAGHYLKGHNRSANIMSGLAIGSLMLIPVVGGIAILTGTAAFGTLVVYNQQWIMSKEYQADDCGYQILEKIHPGAYFRGMEETNTFHIDHAKERLSGEALKKKLEILKKHLALKQAKLKATHKIA